MGWRPPPRLALIGPMILSTHERAVRWWTRLTSLYMGSLFSDGWYCSHNTVKTVSLPLRRHKPKQNQRLSNQNIRIKSNFEDRLVVTVLWLNNGEKTMGHFEWECLQNIWLVYIFINIWILGVLIFSFPIWFQISLMPNYQAIINQNYQVANESMEVAGKSPSSDVN